MNVYLPKTMTAKEKQAKVMEVLGAEHDTSIELLGAKMTLVGSRSIRGAANNDSDWDYLVWCKNWKIHKAVEGSLARRGYIIEGDKGYKTPTSRLFRSWKIPHRVDGKQFNFIVTRSRKFSKSYLLANKVCKRLGLMERASRVAVFRAILYGEEPK